MNAHMLREADLLYAYEGEEGLRQGTRNTGPLNFDQKSKQRRKTNLNPRPQAAINECVVRLLVFIFVLTICVSLSLHHSIISLVKIASQL